MYNYILTRKYWDLPLYDPVSCLGYAQAPNPPTLYPTLFIDRLRRCDTDCLIDVLKELVREREEGWLGCSRRRREGKNVSLDNRPKKNEVHNMILTRKHWDLPLYDPISCPGYGTLCFTLLIDRLWRRDTDGLIDVLKEPVRKREQDLLDCWRRRREVNNVIDLGRTRCILTF